MGLFSFRKRPSGAPVEPERGFYRGPPSPDWAWTPRVVGRGDYPLDLDGSQRYTRPKRGLDFFPAPYLMITADMSTRPQGAYVPSMPLGDRFVLSQAYGRNLSGPIAWQSPYNLSYTTASFAAYPDAGKAA